MSKGPIPHDEFVRRLQRLFSFLKLKNKGHLQTVQILLNDNINLKNQLQEIQNGKQGSSEEGSSVAVGISGVGPRATSDSAGHSDSKDSAAPVHVGESEE